MSALPKAILSAVLLLLIATLWWLRPTPHGALGEYSVEVNGAPLLVATVVEPELFFPNDRRLRERITSNWELSRAPMPHEFPPFSVRWSGTVTLPSAPLRDRAWSDLLFPRPDSERDLPRLNALARTKTELLKRQATDGTTLTVLSDAEYTLSVDGLAIESTDFRANASQRVLAPGPHRFELTVKRRAAPIILALAFYQPGIGIVTLRATDLTPPEQFVAPRGRTWLLAAGSSLMLLCSFAALRLLPRSASGLLGGETRRFHLAALCALTVLAAVLRFNDYSLVPFFTETDDEFDVGWNGWQTLETGVPTGWFFTDAPYSEGVIHPWFGNRYFIVKPAFHRAPLMPLLAGTSAHAAGTHSMFDVKLRDIRIPPIILSLLTLGGVYLAALQLFGTTSALLSALLYAALPLVVIGNRLCKEENALTPLFIFAFLAADYALKSPSRRRWVWVCGALSGLAILAKQTGVAVPLAVSLLLAQRPARLGREVATLSAICVAVVGAWVAYCIYLDAPQFWSVTAFMGSLPGGFEVPLRILLESRIVSSHFGNGLYQWLWLCFAIVAVQERRALWIPVACYLLTIIASAQTRLIFGWYLLPFYPFLCIGAGRFLDKTLKRPHVLAVGITTLLAIIPSLGLLLSRDVTENIQVYRAALLFLLIPATLWTVRPTQFSLKLARGHFALLLTVLAASCVGISLNFFSIYSLR